MNDSRCRRRQGAGSSASPTLGPTTPPSRSVRPRRQPRRRLGPEPRPSNCLRRNLRTRASRWRRSRRRALESRPEGRRRIREADIARRKIGSSARRRTGHQGCWSQTTFPRRTHKRTTCPAPRESGRPDPPCTRSMPRRGRFRGWGTESIRALPPSRRSPRRSRCGEPDCARAGGGARARVPRPKTERCRASIAHGAPPPARGGPPTRS